MYLITCSQNSWNFNQSLSWLVQATQQTMASLWHRASLERSRKHRNVLVRGEFSTLCVYRQQTPPIWWVAHLENFPLSLMDCVCVCLGRCVQIMESSWKWIAAPPKRTQFSHYPKHVFQRCLLLFCLSHLRSCPSRLVFVRFMSNCFPPNFCVHCHVPYNPSLYWLAVVITFYMKALCWKPVMSFCPSGSYDEVDVGSHPKLYNGLRWGIRKCHGLLIESYQHSADKFDVSFARFLILRNISGTMSSHRLIWSGDNDLDF